MSPFLFYRPLDRSASMPMSDSDVASALAAVPPGTPPPSAAAATSAATAKASSTAAVNYTSAASADPLRLEGAPAEVLSSATKVRGRGVREPRSGASPPSVPRGAFFQHDDRRGAALAESEVAAPAVSSESGTGASVTVDASVRSTIRGSPPQAAQRASPVIDAFDARVGARWLRDRAGGDDSAVVESGGGGVGGDGFVLASGGRRRHRDHTQAKPESLVAPIPARGANDTGLGARRGGGHSAAASFERGGRGHASAAAAAAARGGRVGAATSVTAAAPQAPSLTASVAAAARAAPTAAQQVQQESSQAQTQLRASAKDFTAPITSRVQGGASHAVIGDARFSATAGRGGRGGGRDALRGGGSSGVRGGGSGGARGGGNSGDSGVAAHALAATPAPVADAAPALPLASPRGGISYAGAARAAAAGSAERPPAAVRVIAPARAPASPRTHALATARAPISADVDTVAALADESAPSDWGDAAELGAPPSIKSPLRPAAQPLPVATQATRATAVAALPPLPPSTPTTSPHTTSLQPSSAPSADAPEWHPSNSGEAGSGFGDDNETPPDAWSVLGPASAAAAAAAAAASAAGGYLPGPYASYATIPGVAAPTGAAEMLMAAAVPVFYGGDGGSAVSSAGGSSGGGSSGGGGGGGYSPRVTASGLVIYGDGAGMPPPMLPVASTGGVGAGGGVYAPTLAMPGGFAMSPQMFAMWQAQQVAHGGPY